MPTICPFEWNYSTLDLSRASGCTLMPRSHWFVVSTGGNGKMLKLEMFVNTGLTLNDANGGFPRWTSRCLAIR